MKVLWITNTIMKYPNNVIFKKATFLGGWLDGLAEMLKDYDIELYVLSKGKVTNIKKCVDENITYMIINDDVSVSNILNEIKPDLIHINGTEYKFALEVINANTMGIKVVTSIQGIIANCSKVFLQGLEGYNLSSKTTLRDIIKNQSILDMHRFFAAGSTNERKILANTDFIFGRTKWDYENTKAYNKEYLYSGEILRDAFYSCEHWDYNKIEKRSLFMSNAGYPIKGLHILLDSMKELKKEFSDIKLYIGGINIYEVPFYRVNGYQKILKDLIKQYDLKDNIIFLGYLNQNEMIEQMLKANVFILPSLMENSSNTLGEAMLIGTPCVVSDVGGNKELLGNDKYYDVTDTNKCVSLIREYFNNEELCIKDSKLNIVNANKRFNNKEVVEQVYNNYKDIISRKS